MIEFALGVNCAFHLDEVVILVSVYWLEGCLKVNHVLLAIFDSNNGVVILISEVNLSEDLALDNGKDIDVDLHI